MTLFSRKALVACATAFAVTFSGAAVASAQYNPDDNPNVTTEEQSSADTFFADLFAGSSDDEGNPDPKEFRNWISTMTSLIRTLDSVLSIVS